MTMEITFWGTRGGVPVSGPDFLEHGGRTTCLEIAFSEAHPARPDRIIIDCGTGAVRLGQQRSAAETSELLMLQTHMHWDHVQGFPFFKPFYNPGTSVEFWGVDRNGSSLAEVYDGQMSQPTFPVGMEVQRAEVQFESLPERGERRLGDVVLRWDEQCHPSGSTAYRIEHDGGVFVFSGDVEVAQGGREALEGLADGADVLVMDAQYFPDEYEQYEGFGHSTCLDAVDVAERCGVDRLFLTHHDPSHGDERLAQKPEIALEATSDGLDVANARDDLTIVL